MESDYFQSYLDKDRVAERIDYSFSKEVNLFDYLSSRRELHNWIDIEMERANLATRKMHSAVSGTELCKHASELEERTFDALHEALCDYIGSIDYSNIEKDSKALAVLKIIAKYRSAEILSFNYTDLNRLEPYVGFISSAIDNIHGRISDKSIILGIQDEVEMDDSYCFMIKSFSPHYWSHKVRSKLLDADEIIFFGHSLGSTDYHYFQDLFKRQSNAEVANPNLVLRIFTFDENSRRNILIQLRRMNENHTNMLYDLCDFRIYRTGVSEDDEKIYSYLEDLEERLKRVYAVHYIP